MVYYTAIVHYYYITHIMTDKILKFSSKTCGPCQALSMLLHGEDLGVPLVEVDVDTNGALAQEYGIRSIPTLVFVRNDEEVSRLVGTQSLEKIQNWATVQ